MKLSKLILLFLVSVNATLYPILMPGLMPGDFSPPSPRKRIKLEEPSIFYAYASQALANLASWLGFKSEPFPFDDLPLDMKKVIIGLIIDSLGDINAGYANGGAEEFEEGIKDILSFSLTNKEYYALVHTYFKSKIQAIIKKKLMEHWKFKPVELADTCGYSQFIMGAFLYAGTYDKESRYFGAGFSDPLTFAIENSYIAIIPHLLKAGADPNYRQTNPEGKIYSPLVWALCRLDGEKRIEVIRELLKHGGDPQDDTFISHLDYLAIPEDEKRIIQMLLRVAQGNERTRVA